MFRENAKPLPTSSVRVSGSDYRVLLLVLISMLFFCVWVTASVRSQPPERIVRVNVPVSGPERVRVVEVPALPPPRCEDTVTTYWAHTGNVTRGCTNGSTIFHVTISDEWVTIECHCPRTP